jgi:hypothetical protein
MPLRLGNQDVVSPGVTAVRLGSVDVLAKPLKPVPVAWVAHTSAFFEEYGVLHFANDTPHDGGSIVTRYELTADGSTTPLVGKGMRNGRLVNLTRRFSSGNFALFANFTASTATFTVVAINGLGTSEPSDSFTLESLPGGTAVQGMSGISSFEAPLTTG